MILFAVFTVLMVACASPPANMDNICDIFSEKRGWYKAIKSSTKRWGGPIHVPMAIMHQESRFQHDAKPPMRYFLWIIPRGRSSSAYGYAQVLDGTWSEYQKDGGSMFSDRDDFADAIDFTLWYMNKTQRRNGVSKWDTYSQYLNYHEGHGGYARGSYKRKAWLTGVARKVERRANKYRDQYGQCKQNLDKGWLRRTFL